MGGFTSIHESREFQGRNIPYGTLSSYSRFIVLLGSRVLQCGDMKVHVGKVPFLRCVILTKRAMLAGVLFVMQG